MYLTIKFLIKIKMLELKPCSLFSTLLFILSFFFFPSSMFLCVLFFLSQVDDIFQQRKRHVCKML